MPRSESPSSQPGTNVDCIHPSTNLASLPRNHGPRSNETEPSPGHSARTPESAGALYRKLSSITYFASGSKDSRDRVPQRTPKPFVIVIPPASLTEKHGQLGHTLTSGPHHRLSNGILMPLFPTMYGQLSAIAHEFNFPATTGLCLYVHFVENGVTMTPRITDETWPFLWAHVFEDSTPKLPIFGKIEFDLDFHRARWFATWLAFSHREMPSAEPSDIHGRGDSKPTGREDQEMVAPTTRYVPRKLSLVDRYEMYSARPGFRQASRNELPLPEHPRPSSSPMTFPIFQNEEYKTTREDLDGRVNSWLSNANLKSTTLVSNGKTSLETANMPSFLSTDDPLLDNSNEQLNLEDFAWSVTSAGPDDYNPMLSASSDRIPSVHIANRMEGSVCLTPSDRTSFGPSDYALTSPAPSTYRLPSPDIAFRMFENAPQTPSTVTTWGAPTEIPYSFAFSRPPSIDLGERMIFSRPVTPTSATSWGPASWPSSPAYSEYTNKSIHICDRGDFSRPVTPSTAACRGTPLSSPPRPAPTFYVTDARHHGSEDTEYELERSPVSWSPIISANDSCLRTSNDAPWDHSSPYYKLSRARPTPQISSYVPSFYPHLVIYQSVYPQFDLYPGVTLENGTPTTYPNSSLYLDVPIFIAGDTLVQRAVIVRLTPCYPVFDLYPAIYPDNLYKIYSSTQLPTSSIDSDPTYSASHNIETQEVQTYPRFNLYSTVDGIVSRGSNLFGYPRFDLYPVVCSSRPICRAVSGTDPKF